MVSHLNVWVRAKIIPDAEKFERKLKFQRAKTRVGGIIKRASEKSVAE